MQNLSYARLHQFPDRYAGLNRARHQPAAHAGIMLSARQRLNFAGGDSPNLDPNYRKPPLRPSKEHWHTVIAKSKVEQAPDKARPEIKPPPPAPTAGKAGKLAKAAAFMSAMQEMFPPPPNSGLRPVYISSMSIGGKRLEPD